MTTITQESQSRQHVSTSGVQKRPWLRSLTTPRDPAHRQLYLRRAALFYGLDLAQGHAPNCQVPARMDSQSGHLAQLPRCLSLRAHAQVPAQHHLFSDSGHLGRGGHLVAGGLCLCPAACAGQKTFSLC